ncbi:LysR family transcriptional regulator [Paraburkholderia caribensis]|uniref:LysR family transcriptional regulator n=1 Tax=Paraburkholderia caribensis TaxID=75105 RepID=UPI001E2C57D7|nr:LysR family transcriptional regulator [Paraburkholderia caribensis]
MSNAPHMPPRKPAENWDDFRYFLAVARTGTLSAAAERLGTEHTTVSRHIQSLENALKSRLFHKSNIGYELTEVGRRVLETAEAIESAYVLSKAAADHDSVEIEGVVRIGAPDAFGSVFLAPRVQELTEKNPRLEIEIFAAPRVFSLWKREADIAISLSGAEHMRVASRRLTDYRLFVYATKGYLENSPKIRTTADLASHPFAGYVEEGLFAPELNYFDVVSPDLLPRVRSTALLPQVFATLGGRTLGILPAYVAASFPELTPVLPKVVSLVRSFHMQVNEDHRKAANIRVVANFVADLVQSHRSLFMGRETDPKA